ncbi:SLATT domain-containing protein [Gynurincola endophyticus]|uniref:SLATT domain-containing protein n=1 Tax=Gynurincola endophyticus TaxID=2479004 RepID=UPI000F8C6736|nr:SLATT domain-containing protein [Gynurincola endophyticus]
MPSVPRHILINYEPIVDWNASLAKDKLIELYNDVQHIVDYNILWYQNSLEKKSWWARWLRGMAIAFFVLTTIAPYLATIDDENIYILYGGYILAAVAAGLLLFDRFLGLSNSWIRYMITGMELQKNRNEFVKKWQVLLFENTPLTKRRFAVLIDALILYQGNCNEIVQSETKAWGREYQESMKELMSALQKQSEQYKNKIDEAADKEKAFNVDQQEDTSDDENIPIEVIQEAIDQTFEEWVKVFGMNSVSAGKKVIKEEVTDINCLIFGVAAKEKEGDTYFVKIPDYIYFKSVNGLTYKIPTDVRNEEGKIFMNSAKLHCGDVFPKQPGCSISRHTDYNDSGTIGLKVFKGGKSYILSCYHVLCSKELSADRTLFKISEAITDPIIVSPSLEDQAKTNAKEVRIGRVMEGCFDHLFDSAIALIEDENTVSNIISAIEKPPAKPFRITDEHAARRYTILAVGRTSGKVYGRVLESNGSCVVYVEIKGKLEQRFFKGIIKTDLKLTGGDSGAAVLDENSNVIGIVFSTTGTITNIIPIQRILSKFEISIKE